MTLHPFGPGSLRKGAEMPMTNSDLVPRWVGLSTRTALPAAAVDVAAIAIALGRNRRTEWSDSDDTLDRVLRYLKRDWGYTW